MDSIAVIVAAVLALVVVILGFSMLFGSAVDPDVSPSVKAQNLLKSQVNRPGEIRTSVGVEFQNLDTLNPKALAAASGVVLPEQICVSLGDFTEKPGFSLVSTADNSVVTYSNRANTFARLSVLCDTGSVLRADLTKNGLSPEWMDASPPCQAIAQSEQTGCIIALRQG